MIDLSYKKPLKNQEHEPNNFIQGLFFVFVAVTFMGMIFYALSH